MEKNSTRQTIFKGFLVGSTMLVPGVSGGSMAMILGIYENLLSAISCIMTEKKKNFLFLVLFVGGAGLGILFLARPILSLLESYPNPMRFFFVGAVVGGIPAIYKQAQISRFGVGYLLYIGVGIGIVCGIAMLPANYIVENMQTGNLSMISLLVVGIILAVGLVLPGISVSYLLLIMGLYEDVMEAIIQFDFLFLGMLGGGVLGGVLLVTKMLEYIMKKYPQITYLVIIGFVLGSLKEILPGIPTGWELFACTITFTLGYLFIHTLSKTEA